MPGDLNTTIVLPAPTCPSCSTVNELLTCIGAHKPRQGDIAVCISCRKAAIIDLNPIRLRAPASWTEKSWCKDAERSAGSR